MHVEFCCFANILKPFCFFAVLVAVAVVIAPYS